jgi:hypothetical protein
VWFAGRVYGVDRMLLEAHTAVTELTRDLAGDVS